jgi:hypothetical protein
MKENAWNQYMESREGIVGAVLTISLLIDATSA